MARALPPADGARRGRKRRPEQVPVRRVSTQGLGKASSSVGESDTEREDGGEEVSRGVSTSCLRLTRLDTQP